ncbi:hypothetical protein FOCG_15285 [Fusarium oxysporum f. sp. radicis-lycopersici 26381]|nr:hypothetical protein FOCG_15285 [Fusarium oxysporum f. sp. radicis-lycopersici 26381]
MGPDKPPTETTDHLPTGRRQPHKKSRTGCTDYRKRRVKARFLATLLLDSLLHVTRRDQLVQLAFDVAIYASIRPRESPLPV